ncbi:hypothetical protein AUR64_03845 [Haloprofundus marisrubri]|uniref:Uncharacterized protein n=1 Tax=Haloprofundus marisrubri TaxID=1514971 RepID=A0A0W1RDC2_9EURY|nr:hypothetical protein AUR64_03845 [Haloprofundus marisrubri]
MLHVDKDDDLMSILSERIPEFYKEQFDEELSGAEEFKQLRDDIKQSPQTVANNATSGAILNLRQRGYNASASEQGQEDEICEFVREKLQLLVERGEYAQEIKFVTEGSYKQNDFLHVFENSISVSEAVGAINQELWREIRNRYGTASLDDVLEDVGSKFTDTRPVIVFEDFSIAAMEAEKLRNYMERDKGSDNWDFIVAGTRDSTDILHTRTAEDRFEFYQTNKADSNNVLFLDEGSAVNFVRPYLGYIKSQDGSVRYERDEEADTFRLMEPKEGSLCAQCGFCDDSFRDLFPFNETFLQRIYSGLSTSEQSPREFIMKIFEVLQDYYDGIVEAPSSSRGLRLLDHDLAASDEVYERAEQFADLAKWYGENKNGKIAVDRRFGEAFGLVEPAADDDNLPGPITASETEIYIPASGSQPQPTIGTGSSSDQTTDPDPEPEPEPEPQVSRVQRIIEDHNGQIDSWREAPWERKETDHYIKLGLKDAIDRLTDGFSLYEGTSLVYNLSGQKYPFVYPGSDESPDTDQIIINPEEFRRSDLRRLLEFGVYRDEDPRNADYDKLLEQCGTQLTEYALRWRQTIVDNYLEGSSILYKRHARYDFTDFALSTYAYLVMLDSPWEKVTPEKINEEFGADGQPSLDTELGNRLRKLLDPDQYSHVTELFENVEFVEELLGELLGVSSNSLDVPEVRQRIERASPHDVFSMLGRGQIQNIETRVRFEKSRSRTKLRKLANTAYDFRRSLDDVGEHHFDSEAIEVAKDNFQALSMTKVSEIVESLSTYGKEVNQDLLESLRKFENRSQTDVDKAAEGAQLANQLHQGSDFARVHAAVASQKVTGCDVLSTFRDITIVEQGSTTSIGAKFISAGEHYVDE